MKKALISVFTGLLFSLNVFAAAPTVILDYRYNNQIVGSYLKIFSNGSVERSERECCPPKTTLGEKLKLSAYDLETLNDLIAKASAGKTVAEAIQGKYGEMYGVLSVTTKKGKSVLIRAKDLHSYSANDTVAGLDIVAFANIFVTQKMPAGK